MHGIERGVEEERKEPLYIEEIISLSLGGGSLLRGPVFGSARGKRGCCDSFQATIQRKILSLIKNEDQ